MAFKIAKMDMPGNIRCNSCIAGILLEMADEITNPARWLGFGIITKGKKKNKMDAEELAKLFHETYEKLAPAFGYKTRESSRKPWENVPEKNKKLMIAVAKEILQKLFNED